jgi:hypothetical protein
MDLIAGSKFDLGSAESGTGIPITPQEKFVTGVYLAVDETTARGLKRLRNEEGVVASCKLGCCHCCRHHILANVVEAHTLAQYVRRELSADQMDDLRMRTQQWHEWDNSRPGRYRSSHIGGQTDLSHYVPCCPLLVDGACIAYPARPVVCRTHFVRSDPLSCLATNDPESTEDVPVVLASIVKAGQPFTLAMRNYIENAGLDFSQSIMLLPQWLAIQMAWDFALSP